MKELKEIYTEDDLVAAAARKGITLAPIEAYTVLELLGKDGIFLVRDDLFELHYCYPDETTAPATLREICEYAKEIADECYMETAGNKDLRRENVQCAKDLFVVNTALKKVSQIIPPTIKKYHVGIVANYKFYDEIEAASWAEAESIARENWTLGKYVISPKDFIGIFITQSSATV